MDPMGYFNSDSAVIKHSRTWCKAEAGKRVSNLDDLLRSSRIILVFNAGMTDGFGMFRMYIDILDICMLYTNDFLFPA